MTWTSMASLVAPFLALIAAAGNLYVGVQLRIRDREDFERLRDECDRMEQRVQTLADRILRIEVESGK